MIEGTQVSRAWEERVAAALHDRTALSRGPIAHTDRILETSEAKRALARTGGVAADMETKGVALAAEEAGVPWIAVRAIADPHDFALPRGVLRAVDESGAVRAGRFIIELTRHPAELLALPKLASGFRAALHALQLVAAACGASLLAPQAVAGDKARAEGPPTGTSQ
jgi:adenosylhomocysteine nucleosidase